MNIIIVTLLPIIFMIHEFEEILFLKYWVNKDKNYLHNKFPKIGPKIFLQYSKFTIAGLVLAISEEFVVISLLTYIAIIMHNYYIWFSVFMGFSIHLIIHIIGGLFYKKYCFGFVTSILVLPYCIYGFFEYINNETYKVIWIIIGPIIAIVGFLINLKFVMHYFGEKFSIWETEEIIKTAN